MSRGKNSSLSNRPFDEKVAKGFAFGCYSENEVARYKEWTPKEITDRTVKLIKFVDNRWKLGIGATEEDYLAFSGLDTIK